MTKDEKLIILHGGDNGELSFKHDPHATAVATSDTKYVFEHTLSEILQQ